MVLVDVRFFMINGPAIETSSAAGHVNPGKPTLALPDSFLVAQVLVSTCKCMDNST